MNCILKYFFFGPLSGQAKSLVQLTGYILEDGGSPVTNVGFNYGKTPDMEESISMAFQSVEFTSTVAVSGNILYYQAFAENTDGVDLGEMKIINI